MKRIPIILVVLGLISFLFPSCKKYLDTKPTDNATTKTFYQNAQQVNYAVTALYAPLRSSSLWGDLLYVRAFNGSDEGYYYNNTQIGPVNYSNDSGQGDVNGLWQALYTAINNCNNLLDNIDNATGLDVPTKNHAVGETLFLRSYYYAMLVQFYGDVPLQLHASISVNDGIIPRTPEKQVYDQIIKDMTTAEGLLKDQTTATLGYNERVTVEAVQGILARICLYAAGQPVNDTKRYADALAWASKLKAGGLHALNPDYKQIFINQCQDKYDIKESIWEVGFSYLGPAPNQNLGGEVGVNVGVSQTFTTTIGGILNTDSGYCYGFIKAHARMYTAYQPGDVRRDWCIANYNYAGNAVKTPISLTDLWSRYPAKWRRQYEMQISRTNQNKSSTNFPLLRYADVLLMLAEAENEVNGPTAIAYDAINQVRRRARGIMIGNLVGSITVTNQGSGYTLTPIVTISGGGGSGATAVANISGGKVISVTITNPGNVSASGPYYTSNPSVTILGGGGTGATATAAITQSTDGNLTPGLSQSDFRQAVRDERYRELAFECLRLPDLKRWGILVQTIQSLGNDINGNTPGIPAAPATASLPALVPVNNIRARDMLWPIPLHDMGYNPLLTQNPGF